MPKSRGRKKSVYTEQATRASSAKQYSPVWLAPLMLGCFAAGIVWLLVYFLSQGGYPLGGIGAWNELIGFGFILVGFGLATQWR